MKTIVVDHRPSTGQLTSTDSQARSPIGRAPKRAVDSICYVRYMGIPVKFHRATNARKVYELVSLSQATTFPDAGAAFDTVRNFRIARHQITVVPFTKS